MKIGVTSQNKLKIDAVKKAYSSFKPEVIGYSTDSGVNEQPVEEETLIGARNRIADVLSKTNDLDRIVSIENGLFREDEQWLDKAFVIIYFPEDKTEIIGSSDSVVFPDEYVEEARQIGFDIMTVGKLMADKGYVSDSKDPHKSISGISRQVYLEDTLKRLIGRIEKQ